MIARPPKKAQPSDIQGVRPLADNCTLVERLSESVELLRAALEKDDAQRFSSQPLGDCDSRGSAADDHKIGLEVCPRLNRCSGIDQRSPIRMRVNGKQPTKGALFFPYPAMPIVTDLGQVITK